MDSGFIKEVAGHVHAGQLFDAAKIVLRASGFNKEPKTKADALEPISTLVFGLLNVDRYEDASTLLWTPNVFTAEPQCTRDVWTALKEDRFVMMMGASSMSKTYGAGAYFFLDWLRDPEWTSVRVVGPSEDHLQSNLFSHLLALHAGASIPLPGKPADLFIGLNMRNKRACIKGDVIPMGRTRRGGKLQGVKRFPRARPHETFGRLSRLRVLIDEAEKTPPGVWGDVDNLTSNVQEYKHGLKIACSFNPELVGGPVYQRCEPTKGWAAFDIEKDYKWVSKRGWTVVRLDATRSENVMQGKTVYPGLQTKEGLDELLRLAGGYTSSSWFTFGRAAYPPQGTSFTIIPQSFLAEFKAKFFFTEKPRLLMSVDSALEGGDPAMVTFGEWGPASGVELPQTQTSPKHVVMFKDRNGSVVTRHRLQITKQFELEKGKTVFVAKQVMNTANIAGIRPGWVIIDRTGNGAGVHDWLVENWSPEVRGVNYSQSSTHTKIMEEDKEFCDEAYDRIDTEMWFGLRKWIEFGIAKISDEGVQTEALYGQFTGRKYTTGKKSRIQSKQDYMGEGNPSPNEADSMALLIHCARMASNVAPTMQSEHETASAEPDQDDFPVRIGITDRHDDLDGYDHWRGAEGDDL